MAHVMTDVLAAALADWPLWVLWIGIVLLLSAGAKLLLPVVLEPQDLYIDPQRINDEECRLRRLQLTLDDDPEFRRQVKQRMLQGVNCKAPRWYEKGKPTVRLQKAPAGSVLIPPVPKVPALTFKRRV